MSGAGWRWASTNSPGYVAVAGAALLTGWIAARHGLRPDPFYPGVVFVAVGLALSALMVRETQAHVALESSLHGASAQAVSPREVFWRTTLTDRNLSSISQAGLVNNLNDGMAWGLFPLFFSAANLSLDRIGILAAIYPATWGVVQLATGALSDRVGRKWLIATGMWVQAAGDQRGDPLTWVCRVCDRRSTARDRHGDGVSDAACRDRGRGGSRLARLGRRRLSSLARSRLRSGRIVGGGDGRRLGPCRRDVGDRRDHLCLWCCHRHPPARDPAARNGVTMSCCYSSVAASAEQQFSQKRAAEDLAKYRTKGPGATARLLLAGIVKAGQPHGRLLDIGSGAGVLAFELLERGITEAIGVDLSSAYVEVASAEASRRGRTGSVRFVHGDFVGMASQFLAADVVTLDRVVCCYPAYEQLLDQSARRAVSCFALSYPRDIWYVRIWVRLQNFARQLRRNPFRTFVHSASAVEHVIRRAGFELISRTCTGTWCADVYRHV